MKAAVPAILCLILAAWIGLANPGDRRTAPAVRTIPVVMPARANAGFAPEAIDCPGVDEPNETSLTEVLCALERELAADRATAEQLTLAREIRDRRSRVLHIRNEKHALNVQAMEESARLLDSLDPRQREFVLNNRDRALDEIRERPFWQRWDEELEARPAVEPSSE